MISDFLFHKAMPIFLGLLGVSCIDTPKNFVRKLRGALRQVRSVYSDARIETVRGGLLLPSRRSRASSMHRPPRRWPRSGDGNG